MEEQNNNPSTSQGQKTDLSRVWTAMKKHKKLYYITLPVAFVAACLITLGIPNYYRCEVTLAPESGSGGSMGSLASLASSFGVNLGGGGSSNGDAITPMLYPDLMKSTEFLTSLYDIKVQKDEDDRVMTYYDYLDNETKSPWWTEAKKAIFGLIIPKKEEPKKVEKEKVNPFRLTQKQSSMAGAIAGNIKCTFDRRVDVIIIEVTDQDPLVAATVADSVQARLQDALVEYRTKKARHDLEYVEALHKEAKRNYERACEVYADFMDSNQDLILETQRLKQNKLENEMQLLYNNYNAICAQVLAAKAKLQEATPAFCTLQNATVPLGKAGPKRSRIVLMFVFFVFLCTTTWILYKENELKLLLGLNKKKNKSQNA
jgi:hypothetical protein